MSTNDSIPVDISSEVEVPVRNTLNLPAFTPLIIKNGRLNQTILETGKRFGCAFRWGQSDCEFGMRRLAGSKEDGEIRDWFVKECKSLGCRIKIDQIGNIFAIFPGKNEGKPTATGSHLDTQPEAGKYDGILGVLAGLEVLRTFRENNYVPNFDVCVICWFNEEGARFARYCMGSSVWAQHLPLEDAYKMESVTDEKPESVIDSLKNIGYLGETTASYTENEIEAHFELHIEQGPVLEDERKKIGVVTGVQACYWEKISVNGVGAHAGTTPWRLRKDAMQAAAEMIVACNKVAKQYGGLFTCGVIDVKPYSVNIIPGQASFSIDFRHTSDDVLFTMLKVAKSKFDEIVADNSGGSLKWDSEVLAYTPVVNFDGKCIECVSRSAFAQFKTSEVRQIWSGAGHDSCQVNTRVPTSMIFIPSKDGLSHNYYEYSSPEEIENGFKVLLQAIVNYDNYRASKK
ncbi:LAFE_0F01706g1_1 [Lachancea fermentati]|uniref:LAFE_0F01706g1_1 n=1 Tax=Lachancea fermentati TaxID=4955 RepID=A0A1G4MEP6_LACFM|nr:LAFE_0F01706g1_1 [Lachancea fermentati]